MNSSVSIKKVNSQVNIDEKTGKVVSISASTDCDLATNINVDDNKVMTQKNLTMQTSSSLPDLQADEQTSSSSPSSTSNSNNQMQIGGHGKHVILAVESRDDDNLNQINGATGGEVDHTKKKIKLNIDPNFTGSSSSTSSNNLEYENGTATNTCTL